MPVTNVLIADRQKASTSITSTIELLGGNLFQMFRCFARIATCESMGDNEMTRHCRTKT